MGIEDHSWFICSHARDAVYLSRRSPSRDFGYHDYRDFDLQNYLGAVKGQKTLAQLSSEFGIHANQIRQWQKQLLEELPHLFWDRRSEC